MCLLLVLLKHWNNLFSPSIPHTALLSDLLLGKKKPPIVLMLFFLMEVNAKHITFQQRYICSVIKEENERSVNCGQTLNGFIYNLHGFGLIKITVTNFIRTIPLPSMSSTLPLMEGIKIYSSKPQHFFIVLSSVWELHSQIYARTESKL